MEYRTEILKNLNKPIFPTCISSRTNRIFLKYSSKKYRKYSLDLIRNLSEKIQFSNSDSIFYQTLLYHDIVLYNCGNEVIINNLDLLILNCFYISIKSLNSQYHVPSLKKLKNIIKEKFSLYRDNEIVSTEIECLKLLDYNINYMNAFDFLKFFSNENNRFLLVSKNILDNVIYGDIKDYIFKTPYELALDIFNKTKEKIKINSLIINIPPTKKVIINKRVSNYNREKEIKIDLNKKLSNTNNSICNNSTEIFSSQNSSNGNINNSPFIYKTEIKRKKINSSISNNKNYIDSKQVNSSNNVIKNKNQSLSNRTNNSPIQIISLSKRPINIDLKYLSTISKKLNFGKYLNFDYNNTYYNNNIRKKLEFEEINSAKIKC